MVGLFTLARSLMSSWREHPIKLFHSQPALEAFARPRHSGKEWSLEIAPKVRIQMGNNRDEGYAP
jgi:hypothetical protein